MEIFDHRGLLEKARIMNPILHSKTFRHISRYAEIMCIYNASDDVEVSKVFETQDVCHLSGYRLNYTIINHSEHYLLFPNCKFFQQCQ